jgi:hypothetical protein
MFHFKQKNENKFHQYEKQPFATTKCKKERKKFHLLHTLCQFKEYQAVIKNEVWFKWVVERKKNSFPTDV